MKPRDYFKDLSKELKAVQNRIRILIGDNHWPSDGAWKESVLRAVIRRYLPPSFTVGSGFIVTPSGVSTQIDILVCDDSAPILFRDGDFLIATADCVRAAVEVKTSLTSGKLEDSIKKIIDVSCQMRERCVMTTPFIGLFCYNAISMKPQVVLEKLQRLDKGTASYVLSAMCFGGSQFYKFWEFEPQADICKSYDYWHAYKIPELAPGYFIHNFIEFLFPGAVDRAEHMWYPLSGKESGLVGKIHRSVKRTVPIREV